MFYSNTDTFKFNKIYTDYSETTNIDQILQERVRDSRGKAVYKTDEVKTESILLKKGKKAYQNLTEEQIAILKSLNAVPVQRNSGIDGFLSDYINGRPVSVKIQKPDETLAEAVQKLYMASQKKRCEAMILIRTHIDVVSVMEFDAIPDGVIILDSYEMQIDQEMRNMKAGKTTA